jgi:hypothetical protein
MSVCVRKKPNGICEAIARNSVDPAQSDPPTLTFNL